jgi:hypothetical protein
MLEPRRGPKIGQGAEKNLVQIAGYNYGLMVSLPEWLTHYGTQPLIYYKF